MSFVESLGAAAADVGDPAFAVCVGGIALLVSLLLAPPALATALRFLRARGVLARLYWRIIEGMHLKRRA